MDFAFIFIFFIVIAFSITIAIIIDIRDKKTILVDNDKDFIDKFIDNKQKRLQILRPTLSVRNYFIMVVGSGFLMTVLFWLIFPNKSIATFFGFFSIFLPDLILNLMYESKKKRHEERFLRALKVMATSLRASMSLQQSVQEVTKNVFVPSDIREGFKQIDADIRVGIGIEKAFRNYAKKYDNEDALDVAIAIGLQSLVGGSEAKIVEMIISNIENRMMNKQKIKAMFSGTTYVAFALDVIPFLILFILYIFMPDLIDNYFSSVLGVILFSFLMGLNIIGSVVIRKMLHDAKGE